MERTPALFEKIEDYLAGSLSKEEAIAFEEEMALNASLSEEVEKHRMMHEVLMDRDTLDFKNKLKQISKQIKEEDKLMVKKKTPVFFFKIAASIVCLLGAGSVLWYSMNTEKQTQDLYGAYYAPFPVEDNTRGESSDEVQGIISHYTKGIYDSVVFALEKYPSLRKQEPLSLYLGNSYLNTNQEEKAILEFKSVDNKKYHEVAQWYLSLAYLKLNKTTKVEELLIEIIGYDGTYKNRATELLKMLEEQ